MRALVTGFEPFDGDRVNPSSEALARLPPRLGDLVVETRVLPCVFGEALRALGDAVSPQPGPTSCCASASPAGAAELSLERVAINIDDARIPDNDGNRPIDAPGRRRRPAGLFREPADQGGGGGVAPRRAAGGRVEQRRHLRLQPRLLRR